MVGIRVIFLELVPLLEKKGSNPLSDLPYTFIQQALTKFYILASSLMFNKIKYDTPSKFLV